MAYPIIGEFFTIKFTSRDVVDPYAYPSANTGTVSIYVSIDNGATWELIEADVPVKDDGSVNEYEWFVDVEATTEAKIQIVNDYDESIVFEDDEPFTVYIDGTQPIEEGPEMSRYHGVTDKTYERFVIDSGEVRMGYVDSNTPGTLLGATKGGSSFAIETEYKIMEVDGAKGPVKGGRRITKVSAKITANFIEFSTDLLKLALPGSSEAMSGTSHDEITRALQLAVANHKSNVVIIGEVSGSAYPIICGIKNALADGGFEISCQDNEESVVSVQFTGHFDPSDLDSEPWFVRWPHDTNPTTTTTAGA